MKVEKWSQQSTIKAIAATQIRARRQPSRRKRKNTTTAYMIHHIQRCENRIQMRSVTGLCRALIARVASRSHK